MEDLLRYQMHPRYQTTWITGRAVYIVMLAQQERRRARRESRDSSFRRGLTLEQREALFP